MSRALSVDKNGKLVVPESSLEAAIFDILTFDGWRVWRFGWALTEAKREIGEISSPDLLAVRYLGGVKIQTSLNTSFVFGLPMAEVVWVEVKRATGKADAGQKLWHDAERQRGGLVWVAGVDFPATVDGFRDFYERSNLKRRVR